MPLYGKTDGSRVLEYQDFQGPLTDQTTLPPGKPKWLPVVEENAVYDPVTTERTGKQEIIEPQRIVWRYTTRPKTTDEVNTMRQRKIESVHGEATKRLTPTTGAALSQQILALTKLMQLIYQHTDRTAWSQADKNAVAAAVQRLQLSEQMRDVEDTKVGELQALTDPAAIEAYNTATGWPAS